MRDNDSTVSSAGWLRYGLLAACLGTCLASTPKLVVGPEFGTGDSSFLVAWITDLHVGWKQENYDYGTEGWDDQYVPPESMAARRLRGTVRWINQHAIDSNIVLVIITGDFSQSAELSELSHAKEILDSLTVPYVPVLGNHDVWPYISRDNAAPRPSSDTAFPDCYFSQVFDPQYARLETLASTPGMLIRNWTKLPNRVWSFGTITESMKYWTVLDVTLLVPTVAKPHAAKGLCTRRFFGVERLRMTNTSCSH